MAMGERLRSARKAAGLTQSQLAQKVGVTLRSIQFYEQGDREPKTSAVYQKLSQALGVSTSYFISENELILAQEREEFLERASEKYGSRGKAQAELILEQASALFAGGELSTSDQEAFMKAMMDIYFHAKEQVRKQKSAE